ncbi:carbohydrate-binding module family 20 domain-containing protein [Catenuloplanes atrovinosus]|uniref:Alpha-amylase n=1 Tax=Catenuloplanes atrovinosus TaxID=137266 RepID=A0AAE3YU71_9ACTN|nr:carbohydrate-binding module family 20 domain-containing protein [Catenuloplanes atrovinosus]MDR7278484.1 alpha-amylase [Catenuloplanes atrovinosus]
MKKLIARALVPVAVAAAGLAAVTATTATAQAAPALNNSDVTANLWEWNWRSIGAACRDHLGPAGYGAVQVAPPAESVSLATSDGGAHPWWEVYQPVSYKLTSRLGTRAEFAAMVTACHDAGVRVYADAVINHMAGANNTLTTTYGGSTYSPSGYGYPAVPYGYDDFHHANDGYCADDDAVIDDWNNTSEVQNCMLLSLSDLKTQSATVRSRIAGYLNDLISLGVDGFRVDAAKHVARADFTAIRGLLHPTTAEGRAPYIAQEIFTGSTNPELQPAAFTSNGDVLGFSYAQALRTQFVNGTLNNLAGIPSWSLDASSDQTAAMITNHDLERDGTTLRYSDGARYPLANYFLLAYPYGQPFVYDGFTFSTSNTGASPPADANGFVTDANCGNGQWQCLHRSTGVKGMVGWHNATAAATTVSDFTATASNVIGFRRGALGWFGLNASGAASTATYRTGLPDGVYCDVITGGATGTGCAGSSVTVSGGSATVTIPANGAFAIHAGSRSGGGTGTPTPNPTGNVAVTFNANVTTTWGTSVFVTGNVPALGGWNPAAAVPLSSAGYPVWSATVTLPANTAIEYKYIKKDGAGTVTWESGGNRAFTTGAGGTTARNDAWK